MPDDLKKIEAEVQRRLEQHRQRLRSSERRVFGAMDDTLRRADDVFAAADRAFEQAQREMDETHETLGLTWQRIVPRGRLVVFENALPDEPPPPKPAPAPKSLWERLDEAEEIEPKVPAPEPLKPKLTPTRRRISGLIAFSLGALLAVVGFGLWFLWRLGTS